jgi:hypothetical protein
LQIVFHWINPQLRVSIVDQLPNLIVTADPGTPL